jgi:hypothetical protein
MTDIQQNRSHILSATCFLFMFLLGCHSHKNILQDVKPQRAIIRSTALTSEPLIPVSAAENYFEHKFDKHFHCRSKNASQRHVEGTRRGDHDLEVTFSDPKFQYAVCAFEYIPPKELPHRTGMTLANWQLKGCVVSSKKPGERANLHFREDNNCWWVFLATYYQNGEWHICQYGGETVVSVDSKTRLPITSRQVHDFYSPVPYNLKTLKGRLGDDVLIGDGKDVLIPTVAVSVIPKIGGSFDLKD